MPDHFKEFPFEEIKRPDGDYFRSWEEAKAAGFDDDQIWSLVESEGTYTYGPPHHYVNHQGHVATQERHDNETYYHEEPDQDEFEDEEDEDDDIEQAKLPPIPETLTESFIQQYRSGAQGCDMEYDTAQQLALAIEAQRKALKDLLAQVNAAHSPDVSVRMKDFRHAIEAARAALKM